MLEGTKLIQSKLFQPDTTPTTINAPQTTAGLESSRQSGRTGKHRGHTTGLKAVPAISEEAMICKS